MPEHWETKPATPAEVEAAAAVAAAATKAEKERAEAVEKLKSGPANINPWKPETSKAENFSRSWAIKSLGVLLTGKLQLFGGMVLPPEKITKISFYTGSQGVVGPTHQWFCLVEPGTLKVLFKTADDTNVAWAASARKTLENAAGYTPTEYKPVYVGVVVTTAETLPTLRGAEDENVFPNTVVPLMNGRSTEGLTTPASLGETAAVMNATGAAGTAYCTVG